MKYRSQSLRVREKVKIDGAGEKKINTRGFRFLGLLAGGPCDGGR